MGKTVADVLEMGKEAKMVDLRFMDLPGTWQHYTLPVSELSEDLFEEGNGFDGSSVRGFQEVHESDMILIPDPDSAFMDPVLQVPTLNIICNVYDPITREAYTRDPRHVAKKAEAYLKETGIADISFWGPEAEFFLFNDVQYATGANMGMYMVDSVEGWWNSGKDLGPNLGAQLPPKGGYFPVPPADTLQDVRSNIVLALEEAGIQVELHHHEVATAGQCEIDLRFDTLTRMSDKLVTYKYLVKSIARQHGLTATFMPKPLYLDNGSGMHTHQSIWKDGETLMYADSGYANLSDTARYYIGGLLKHAPTLLAFAAPTTNSYKRLVPGFEAPVTLAYSQRNRSAICRIPVYSPSPKAKRVEFRAPDPSCNPYLAFSAMLMAGLDGIQNQTDPGDAVDKDLYELPPEEQAELKQVPGDLGAVLDCLEDDHDFLLAGDVFTSDLIDTWIAYKHENEIDEVRMRPHPHEFVLYFDI